MKTVLIVFSVLLISACGLMPPKVESVEQDLTVPAIICGDSSDVFTVLFYDSITVNVIAVDDDLVPTFREEKRNLIGIEAIPNLRSYCMNMSAGKHKITLLAERGRGMGTTGGIDYYIGSCVVRLAKSGQYAVVPKRSGDWYEEVVVQVRAQEGAEPAGICELSPIHRKDLFERLKKMRHAP